MADPRFFSVKGPFTLGQLADVAEAELHSGADPERVMRDVAPLDTAGAEEISFLDNVSYLSAMRVSKAGACMIRADYIKDGPSGMALLISDNPYRSIALVAQAFYPESLSAGGVSAAAHVDPSAMIGDGTAVAAGAFIGARVEIGARCIIGPNTVIHDGVVIGDDASIGANVSIAFCIMGSHVRILAGARIGEEGFGFALGPGGPVDMPQLGRVIIGDDVEIGANTTIDRGAGPDTIVGDGCRIDNLVQIGHNVQMGRGCIIVAQVGISGSTKLGDYAIMAGQAGVAGHLSIGSGARVGAQAGVIRDVENGVSVVGTPAMPVKQFFRQVAALKRLTQKKGQ